ncbi:aldo/keto reductase family oxidoreductase (macronuclear) [Tetrahymena thermophila SB210]|uniref:Aldo/keto reductase family oxidoreductase n=1 Tax=Tetrahymena thermophila (strain SB210) TaxID=312017 RepID=A4VDA7_TETTS|nr:aldo/keto reductase family oxidoreductase [Tetrahymena thermophila SB210]EDK31511.1 aldo/keto reductase family oxidoreductase [Tetrahymena thermophila SB210]|eukprot:XP_001470919.1 aldo/keto reductase family oxidoreductase [Tetrahymena thermophila SB210]
MEYRSLGNTGLKVSVISFGTMVVTDDPLQQEKTNEHVKKAWDLGINYFDTSEYYGYGLGEIQLGVALKSLKVPREDIVVSTKIFLGSKIGDINCQKINSIGLSRKHIKEGVKNSLKRLQLDYADIVFCHRFDHETPFEEIARAFTELIQAGVIHYWGTSEWSAANIFEMREICAEKNLIKPCVEQPQYNMIARDRIESEYARLFDKYRMGSTVWSPLAQGILAGKYNQGGVPESVRFEAQNSFIFKRYWNNFFSPEKKDHLLNALGQLADYAKELDMTQAQLAMCWVLTNKDVSTAITGCSRAEQLEETVKCVQMYKKLTPEVLLKLEKILGNTPDQGINYKTFTPLPTRR